MDLFYKKPIVVLPPVIKERHPDSNLLMSYSWFPHPTPYIKSVTAQDSKIYHLVNPFTKSTGQYFKLSEMVCTQMAESQ